MTGRPWRPWPIGAGLLFAGTVMLVLGPAPAAEAHTFVVRTVPAQGERLDAPPREVSLEFSETFSEQGARLDVIIDGRTEPLVAERTLDGRVLRADAPAQQDGVYVVSWQVVAEDGHQAAGEFAFGVGADSGAIPSARTASSPPSWVLVVAGWLFFAGLALAAGSLAAQWAKASAFRLGAFRAGLLLAGAGALVTWVDALAADEPTRQRLLLAATATAVAVAAMLVRLARRWPAALAVAGAAIAWSARGHNAVDNGLPGGVLDAVHLLAGATWLGALGLLVVDLRTRGSGADLLTVARRYARLAAILVAVLAVAGLGSAILLLDRVSDLWSTGYGQTLAVKTGLFAAALALAAVGRRALGRGEIPRLRRVTPVEAGLVVGVLALTAVLVNLAPPESRTVAAASLLGPAPLEGPVARDAGLAANLTVAVSAANDQLRVEVFAPGGDPADDAEVELEAELPDGDERTLVPRPCGPGCFTQRIALPPGTTRLAVAASAPDWPSGTYLAALEAPASSSDPTLVADLVDRMRAVPAVEFVEATTSGPGSVVTPGTFTLSGPEFVDLEPWAAGTADDVQPLGDERGFRMYLPGDRIWITVWQDDQGRIARERIVSMSHEIERDRFVYPGP
jgi:copper transport protein